MNLDPFVKRKTFVLCSRDAGVRYKARNYHVNKNELDKDISLLRKFDLGAGTPGISQEPKPVSVHNVFNVLRGIPPLRK